MEEKIIEAIEKSLGTSGCTPQPEVLLPFVRKAAFLIWYFNMSTKYRGLAKAVKGFKEETGMDIDYFQARRLSTAALGQMELLDKRGEMEPNENLHYHLKVKP